MDAVEGATVREYSLAVGPLIHPSNILFMSRISNNRVCMYLTKQNHVDNLVNNNTTIKVGANTITIRPLMSKSKRVTLSNVCPVIPHTVIENKLMEFNVKPVSRMTFIRAGQNDPGYSHIMSFRRQFYVHPDDCNKLPGNFQIDYDGTSYWIYVSTDNLTCFLCKEEGHLAKYCKTHIGNTQSSQQTEDTANVTNDLHLADLATGSNTQPLQEKPSETKFRQPSNPSGTKRPHSDTSSDIRDVLPPAKTLNVNADETEHETDDEFITPKKTETKKNRVITRRRRKKR